MAQRTLTDLANDNERLHVEVQELMERIGALEDENVQLRARALRGDAECERLANENNKLCVELRTVRATLYTYGEHQNAYM